MLNSDLNNAVLLSILEGLTEYLPVSSTGHLVLFGDFVKLSFGHEAQNTFSIFIQLGAILAVVVLYPGRFLDLIPKQRHGPIFERYSGIIKIGLACLPALVAGALFHKTIKAILLETKPVAIALIIGAIIMILVDKPGRDCPIKSFGDIGFKESFIIGCFQCFALWPGMSRSASTIVGGLFVGCERRIAAEFSFIVAVPIMCAAVAFDVLKNLSFFSLESLPIFLLGFVCSFGVAILSIKFLMRLLSRYTLRPFAYYRICLGVLVLCWSAGLFI